MDDLNIGIEDNGAEKTLRDLASALTELKQAFDRFATTPVGHLAKEFEKLGSTSTRMAAEVSSSLEKVGVESKKAGRKTVRLFEESLLEEVSASGGASVKALRRQLQAKYEQELSNGIQLSVPVLLKLQTQRVALSPDDLIRVSESKVKEPNAPLDQDKMRQLLGLPGRGEMAKLAGDLQQDMNEAFKTEQMISRAPMQEDPLRNLLGLPSRGEMSALATQMQQDMNEAFKTEQMISRAPMQEDPLRNLLGLPSRGEMSQFASNLKAEMEEAVKTDQLFTKQPLEVAEGNLRNLLGLPSRSEMSNFARQLQAEMEAVARGAQVANRSMVANATRNAEGVFQSLSDRSVTVPAPRVDASLWSRGASAMDAFQQAARGTSGQLREMHSAVRGLASGFNAMWLTWGSIVPLLAGAAVSNAFVQSIKKGSEFTGTLEEIRIQTGATRESIEQLSAKAIEMGRTGPFGPLELASAFKTLALAGLDVNQQIQAIDSVKAFSLVGGTDMKGAAETLVAVATAYGYTASEYSVVADAISTTSAASMASVESMSEAFKQASVVAQQYGVSLKDTSLTIAMLSQIGIQGSAAGTAMRNMYSELMGSSKKAAIILKDFLNVDVWNESAKAMRPIRDIMVDMMSALGKYDSKSQQKLLGALGNERGTKAFVADMQALRAKFSELGDTAKPVISRLQEAVNSLGDTKAGKAAKSQMAEISKTYTEAGKVSSDAVSKLQKQVISELSRTEGTDAARAQLAQLQADYTKTSTTAVTEFDRISAILKDSAGYTALAAIGMAGTTQNQIKAVWASLETTLVEAFGSSETSVQSLATGLQKVFGSEEFRNGVRSLISSLATLAESLITNAGAISTVAVGVAGAYTAMQTGMGVLATYTALTEASTVFKLRSTAATAGLTVAEYAQGAAARASAVGNTALAGSLGAVAVGAGPAAVGLGMVVRALGPILLALAAGAYLWGVWKDAKDKATAESGGGGVKDALQALTTSSEAIEKEITALERRAAERAKGASDQAAELTSRSQQTIDDIRKNGATAGAQLAAEYERSSKALASFAASHKDSVEKIQENEKLGKRRNLVSGYDESQYRRLMDSRNKAAEALKSHEADIEKRVGRAEKLRQLAQKEQDDANARIEAQRKNSLAGTHKFDLGDLSGGSKAGLGSLPKDNEAKELEKQLNIALRRLEDFASKRKTILDNARQAEALSQGQYNALELQATTTAEFLELQEIESRTPAILAAYEKRNEEILRQKAKVNSSKATAEQKASAIERLDADLKNLSLEETTFKEAMGAKRDKVETAAEVRIEKIRAGAIGAINRLKEEEREYLKSEDRRAGDQRDRVAFEAGLIGMAESRVAILKAEYEERKRLLDMERPLADEISKRERDLEELKKGTYSQGPITEEAWKAAAAQIAAEESVLDAMRARLGGRRANYGTQIDTAGIDAATAKLAQLANIDLASVFDKASVSINGMKVNLGALANQMVEVSAREEAYAKLKADANKQGKSTAALDKQITASRLNDGASLIGMVKSYAKEGTKTYKTLQAAEQVYYAAQLAMGMSALVAKLGFKATETAANVTAAEVEMFLSEEVTAAEVANSATKAAASGVAALANALAGPFPANLAAFATVGALLAGLGIATGVIGGTSGSFAPTNEGTGTVLGDVKNSEGKYTQKSESLSNSLKLLESLNTLSGVQVEYTRMMVESLRNLESQIGGVSALTARSGSIGAAGANIGEGFRVNTLGKTAGTGARALLAMSTFGLSELTGVGAVLGKAVSKGFGTSVKIKGQGLMADDQSLGSVLDGGLNLDSYADVQKKKKSFWVTTSTKNSTERTRADSETSSQFGGVIRNLAETVAAAAGPIFGSVAGAMDQLRNYTVSIGKLQLDGLNGEQIQEKLNAVFSAEGDKMAKFVAGSLSDLQLVGEGMYETLVRVSSNLVTVNDTFKTLGYSIQAMGVEGAKWAVSLTDSFGGLEKFQSSMGKYYESFYTEEERTATTTQRLTKALQDLGFGTMPKTVAEYRKMVDGFVAGNDMSSEAAQQTYASLIQLSEPFAEITKSTEELRKELIQSSSDILDYVNKLKGDRGGLATPAEKLTAARNQYISDLSLARTGDADAMKSVSQSADDYIKAQKDVTASSSFTQAVIDQIIAELTSLGEATKKGVPAFASGGYHSGGWALVGEEGPEMAYFDAPARIYNAKQTAALGDNSELVAEVRSLREEVSRLRAQQSKETGDIINSNLAAQRQAADRVVDGVAGAAERSAYVQQTSPTLR